MKEKATYNPQDMEDLLLNKSFDELYSDEKEFVLTEVENEQEYKEMRETLLAVKQIAAEQESVYVPNRIKEDLMKLMEKKKKPFGWFSLNSIGSFLFPSNTPLFRKPGLQFATLALLLLFVINIGIDFVNVPNKEMAINTTPNKEIKKDQRFDNKLNKEKKQEVLTEEDSKEDAQVLNNGIINDLKIENKEETPAPPEMVVVQDKNNLIDALEVAEDIKEQPIVQLEEVVEEDVAVVVVQPQAANRKAESLTLSKSSANKDIVQTDQGAFVTQDLQVDKLSYTNTNSTVTDMNGFVFQNKTIEVTEKTKPISTKLNSQSLSDNAEVIDLLFVTL